MSIDREGTAPGLKPTVEKPEHVHMRCKSSPTCDSMLAIEVKIPGQSGAHTYRCVKCQRTWGIRTGGGIDI